LKVGANITKGVWIANQDRDRISGKVIATVTEHRMATVNFYAGIFGGATGTFTATLNGSKASAFRQKISSPIGFDRATNVMFVMSFKGPATLSMEMETNPSPCTDTICVQPSVTQKCGSHTGDKIDLTAEGHTDCGHFTNDTDGAGVNRKADGGAQIQASSINTLSVQSYVNDATSFSWSNGDETAPIESNVTTGIYVSGNGNGFKVTFPVPNEGSSVVEVFLGVYNAQGTMVASISDGSAGDVTLHLACEKQHATENYRVKINVQGANAGSTVSVAITQSSNEGNVTLQAAALTYITAKKAELQKDLVSKVSDGQSNINFQAVAISTS
jgi:hypothetical protein